MSRPSSILREASVTASSSQARRPRFPSNALGSNASRFRAPAEPPKGGRDPLVHHIVLGDIPRSATVQDVLRALKQSNIVKKDFLISHLTMPPPSFPRGPSQTKSVHLTLADVDYQQAHHAVRALLARPLFPDTSSWAQGPRPASNLGMRPNAPAYAVTIDGATWVRHQMSSVERRGLNGNEQSRTGREPGWNSDSSARQAELPSVEWCMDSRNRGRRVLLRGLPGMAPEFRIRQAVSDYGVETTPSEGGDNVKQLPPSSGSFTSTWVVTTDSVNNACRLVRNLNRKYWNSNHFGEKYLIRAEVVW